MLIELTIKNCASFKEETTLSMIASSDTTNEEQQTQDIGKLKVLKNAFIYGANASGKSNILYAMNFLKKFVINSSKNTQQGEPINVNPYRFSTETENEPSLFEIIFKTKEVIYRYGFEADKQKIVSEWLYARYSSRESKLFLRQGQSIELGDKFKEGKNYTNAVRENALFLSVCAQFNGAISNDIIHWFQKINIITTVQENYKNITVNILEDKSGKFEEQKKYILDIIRGADVGIEDILLEFEKEDISNILNKLPYQEAKKIEALPSRLFSLHKKYDAQKNFVEEEKCDFVIESTGTKKLFELIGPIIDTLFNDGILFIDEIQNSLHTKLVIGLINFIVKQQGKSQAQFIITTHDVNLLAQENFRRDQYWFVEKNKYGESELNSLWDFDEHVRKDANRGKDYLRGRYGAIPYLNL